MFTKTITEKVVIPLYKVNVLRFMEIYCYRQVTLNEKRQDDNGYTLIHVQRRV